MVLARIGMILNCPMYTLLVLPPPLSLTIHSLLHCRLPFVQLLAADLNSLPRLLLKLAQATVDSSLGWAVDCCLGWTVDCSPGWASAWDQQRQLQVGVGGGQVTWREKSSHKLILQKMTTCRGKIATYKQMHRNDFTHLSRMKRHIIPLVSPKEVEKVKKSDRSPSKEAKKGEGGVRWASHFFSSIWSLFRSSLFLHPDS